METGLAGKVVLITGATRNHGRASALAFAREGAHQESFLEAPAFRPGRKERLPQWGKNLDSVKLCRRLTL